MTEREHGTYATWNWHIPMCKPCREAARAHQAEWRAAHSRALWRLARIYPAEFQALVAEERDKGNRP